MLLQREFYMNRIRPLIENGQVKVLAGMRRCGKSALLEQIRGELAARGISRRQVVSIDLEDMRSAPLCAAGALKTALSGRLSGLAGKAYLFIDEIQEAAGWELCLKELLDEADCDIYIAGSNARLLFERLEETLAGRYAAVRVYPLSFKEFIPFYRAVYPEADVRRCFETYQKLGGLPFLWNLRFQEAACRGYLLDAFYAAELKDIVRHSGIRDAAMLDRILACMFAGIGTPVSPTAIARKLKTAGLQTAPETVLNYIRGCKDASLLYRVKRQDLLGDRLLTVHEKYYAADHGLWQAVCGGADSAGPGGQDGPGGESPADGSRARTAQAVLENILFTEFLRRGFTVRTGKIAGRDVGFACEKNGEKVYVQTLPLLDSAERIRQKFGALLRIRDNFPKYVVTMDEQDFSQDGIRHRNVRDFLLADFWTQRC